MLTDDRIGGVHRLRTRMAGSAVMIQMHVDLDAALAFREAHAIVEAAEARLKAEIPEADVIIHPDPREKPSGRKRATAVPASR